MSTSGVYTYTVSRDTLIRNALINTGKIGGTQFIAPQLVTDCAVKLNLLVRQWMGKQDYAPGLKMWSRQTADLFLSSSKHTYRLGPTGDQWAQGVAAFTATDPQKNFAQGQLTLAAVAGAAVITVGTANIANITVSDYLVFELNSGDIYATTASATNPGAGTVTIPAPGLPSACSAGAYLWNYTTKGQRPLEIQTCVLRDINNNDTPIDYLTLQTYEYLPTKAMSTYRSDPSAIYYQQDLVNGTLRIDCGGAQDVTKHLNLVYLRPLQAFINPLDNCDFSEEWQLALEWGLTKQIAPMMNAAFTKDMQDNLNESLAIARGANPETTELYFEPNADRP